MVPLVEQEVLGAECSAHLSQRALRLAVGRVRGLRQARLLLLLIHFYAGLACLWRHARGRLQHLQEQQMLALV